MTAFLRTAETYRQGARTLPGRYYTAPEVLTAENERIFSKQWIAVGRASDVPQPGDFRQVQVAGEPLILVRDQGGALRAFYNICRHRGTRLCSEPRGTRSETIQCPYHAWTYALDGRLIGAPHMNEVDGFDKGAFPLHSVALTNWDGFLFVNLETDPEPFAQAFAPLMGRLTRFNLPDLVTVRRTEYDVRANWKLILQNYSECLHCPTIHPELTRKLPYLSGANDLVDGRVLGGYMQIAAPHASATLSGQSCGLPLGTLPADDLQRAYYYTIFPAMMLSLHPDYAVFYTVHPVQQRESRVVCEWLVHPDSPASPGYNIADAEEFWDRTNRQDWHICEESQIGMSSRAYQPGPYSPRESIPAAWDREYLRAMGELALG